MTKTLELNNVTCERDERVLFERLNFQCQAGDLVHLIGPNGAGKTTLLRILTGLSSSYEGEICWCGRAAKGYDFFSELLYIGHAPGVQKSLTPLENLRWYFGLHGRKSASAGAQVSDSELKAALKQVRLAGYDHVPCYQLSAGQQRRVALARLYVSEASLWILDEPFTAIDKQGVAQLEQTLINHTSRGGIVILTTHQSPATPMLKILDLAAFADRVSAG